MIDLKLARIVPYKREDVVFDYSMAGLDDVGYTRVLLSVLKNDAVRRCVGIVEKAGCEIERIVLSSYGLWEKARGLALPQDPGSVFLALDIDTDFTDCIIFTSSALLFSRSINIGARGLLENKDGVVMKFTAELNQSLMMFYNEEMNKKPVRAFVTGAKVGEHLAGRIESGVVVPVTWVGSGSAGVSQDASTIGLARISTRDRQAASFVLADIQIRRNLSRMVHELVILGGLCVYLLSVGYAAYWGKIYHQQNYLVKVQEKAAEVQKTLGDLPDKLKKVDFVRSRLEERKAVLFLLVELQKIVPANVAVISVSMDDAGKIIVRGQAQELADVFAFIDNIQKEKCFQDIQTRSTKKKKILDREIIDFELNFILG
jgi:hypothetical protein